MQIIILSPRRNFFGDCDFGSNYCPHLGQSIGIIFETLQHNGIQAAFFLDVADAGTFETN